MEIVFNFGKYKFQTIDEIYKKDKQYLKWVCQQSWFMERRKELYEKTNRFLKNMDDKIIYNTDKFIIYTDGACSFNGDKKRARCSIGIYFSDKNNIKIDDVSEKLHVKNPSNNIAELTAILRAFQLVKKNNIQLPIELYTDSSYCYSILIEWYEKWIRNDLLDNKKNLELIKQTYDIYKTINVELFLVKAHTKNQDEHSIGNRNADQFAKNALRN
tara:strand:+ start:124 stop:768 length:645 start_codon:yes stop_codon:yes gene_type:complete